MSWTQDEDDANETQAPAVESTDPRRLLPSVDRVLRALEARTGLAEVPHERKASAARMVLQQLRETIGGNGDCTADAAADQAEAILLSQQQQGLRRVVNGTGIVLHTNLGRAVLPREALDAVAELDGCSDLQIDLETGSRGRRDARIEALIRALTGAEAALVVNNNAAATLLVLAALCRNREVIVSRGQLIEIGGSFRLPDVIEQSGARMVEVGTTNKTHLRDYDNAITGETAVLLRVNPSNYRIAGFTKSVTTAELAQLRDSQVFMPPLVVDDLGCGCLIDLSRIGLPREPTVQESLAAGADVVLFSGDKLIGGPQAGVIAGRKACVDVIRKHPLARALRVGKFTIAALEATLKLFLNPDTLIERNPTLRMLALKYDALLDRAAQLAGRLETAVQCEVVKGESLCGGGALPDTRLETALVAVHHPHMNAAEFARRLRLGEPSVVARVREGTVLIDARTLLPGDEERIVRAVQQIVEREKP